MANFSLATFSRDEKRQKKTHRTKKTSSQTVQPDGSVISLIDEHPFAGGIATDLLRGTLVSSAGQQRIVIKKWRICSRQIDQAEILRHEMRTRVEQWQTVRHRNIVQISWPAHGLARFPALVLPYYRHGNVLNYISAHPSVNILRLLLDVAEGLDFMHNMTLPVAHGTLRSSNILVDDEGTACLTDIAINLIPLPPSWTLDNMAYSRWLAPEVLLPDSPDLSYGLASPESDVYSFGMTTIEMFTGRKPFAHRQSHIPVVLDVIRGQRPRKPTPAEAPQLTDSIWNIAVSCWAHDPVCRPSITAVRASLQALSD